MLNKTTCPLSMKHQEYFFQTCVSSLFVTTTKSIYHTKHLTIYWDNSLALTNHTICHVTHVSGGTVRCLKYLRLLSIPASTSMILSSSRQSVCFLCISFMMSTCCFKNSLTPNCNIHKIYQEKSLRYKRVVL